MKKWLLKIKKLNIYKKLISQKLFRLSYCFDNDYIGIILGYFFTILTIIICIVPCAIISLFQLKSYINKIKNKLNDEFALKSLLCQKLVEKVVEDD